MSSDIQPGDVVQKVGGPCYLIPLGTFCRVKRTGWWAGGCGVDPTVTLWFFGWPDTGLGYDGYNSKNFRKIRPAEDQFVQQVRACRPLVHTYETEA